MFKRAQFLLLAAMLFIATQSHANEFDTLRLRWRNLITQGTNSSFSNPLYQTAIASLSSSAMSYSNSLNTSPGRTYLWTTYQNLATDSSDISGTYSRLRTMALAYAVKDSSLEGNTGLRSAVISGLDWMYANYYNETSSVYDNWFDFEIATPLALNDIVVLLYSNLSPAQITSYMGAVDHFTPTPGYSFISTNLTAANKIWKSLVVAVRGTIVQNSAKIDMARQGLSDVFPYVHVNDGFYADGSFIFHNYFPYNAGYGVELLDSTAAMMQLLQGSTWQIVDPARTNVFRWVYDSFEPFIVRGAAMEMVDGRYHTRNGNAHERGHELLGAILRIAQVAPPTDAAAFKSFVKGAIQADTYRNFITSQLPPYNVWADAAVSDTNIQAMGEIVGHRQFPGMDRIVHRTANWTFGLSMFSTRVANYESTRGENLHGWFTGEGMTYLYNGDLGQYSDNFWSTVDPYRMPGTTIENYPRADGFGDAKRGLNSQVGGASIQGLYGVAAMHLDAYNSLLSGRKSWFMFDSEIVCLGNSISDGTNGAVETVIENRRLGLYGDNAFSVNGAAKPSGPGWAETMTGTSWAHLTGATPGASIGYFFPQSATVKALRESRSGAMKDINTTYGSTTKNTRHYLTMYFDHGTNPSGGTYSYVLLPGMSASNVAAYAANPEITVVQNNSNASAVRKNALGLTAVNFWRDASNAVSGAGINCDRRASVIWRNDGSVLEVGVSDPTQTNIAGINIEMTNVVTALLSADAGVTVLQTNPLKLWFNTTNTSGATLHARFAVSSIQMTNLAPIADAYVQNGDQTNVNFGGTSTLQVKLAAGSSLTRESFLRFDLSPVPGAILDANLRLVPLTTNEVIIHNAAKVTNSSWNENTINWTNKPTSGPEILHWSVPVEKSPVFIPITTLAQEAWAGDGNLSLRIYSTNSGTNGGFTSYHSREHGTVTNRPQLAVNYTRIAPTVVLSNLSGGSVLDAPAAFTLVASAQDSDGEIALVEFYRAATKIGQVSAPPYSVPLAGLGAGSYALTAVATDDSGLKATSAPVNITVYAPEPPGRGTGLNAEYFFDRVLSQLFQTRIDTNINFNWGNGAPIAGMSPNDFSVRWTGRIQARHAGVHQFHAVSDEGVRLWVDGRLLIDDWTGHLQTEDTGSITLVPGRYYDITMEYFEGTASAAAQLYWTQPGVAKEVVPMAQLYPADRGLRGAYYSGANFNVPVFTRIDEAVNFNWNTNSPDPTAMPVMYSVRWTGKVKANAGGLYQFFTLSDDGVRLWVNGQILVSNWLAHATTEDSGSISLVAGQFYDVTLEYFNATGAGTAVLSWLPPGGSKQVIPTSNLTPHRNNNPPVLAWIPNQVAARNNTLTFATPASDLDAPVQSLTYSLDAGAPVGAAIHPTSGQFSWTPSMAQAFGPQAITVRVTDNGSPVMTDAQTFTVTVLTNAALSFASSGGTSLLTWPQSAGGAQLYAATNLAPPVFWSQATNVPFLTNGQWAVTFVTPTNGSMFYRLQMP